jgi:hypothetical protein
MMDMEKLFERLVAIMDADKDDYLAILDADRKARREDMASEIEAW